MFSIWEYIGFLLSILPIVNSASLNQPRFFTGIFLDALADDNIGGSSKDTLREDPIPWNELDDYYNYENEYYEDFYGNNRRNYNRRNYRRLSGFEDPLSKLLRRKKSQSNFDDEDDEDSVYGYEEGGYDEDDSDVENIAFIRRTKKKESNEDSNEDDDEEDETDDGYEDDGYEEDDDDDDENEEEDSEETHNSVKKKTKRKPIVKNSGENYETIGQPDAEGNIFIELKDDEKVEASVVKINKKKKKPTVNDNENSDEDDDEDSEEVEEDTDENDDSDKNDEDDEDNDDDDRIVVLCVVDVKSRVSGNSQIIHARGLGYPGQMFERLIPTIGYRNVVPANSPRRIEARHYTDPDDPDQDMFPPESQSQFDRYEAEDNDEMDPYNYPQKRKPSSGISQIAYNENKRKQQYNQDGEDENEENEDEADEHMASNTADNIESVGDKLGGDDEDDFEEEMGYRSNKVYLNIPAHAAYPKRSQTKIRYSTRNYPSKENLRRSNKKTKSVKRKRPSQISDEDYYQSNYQKVNIAQRRNENYKQQLNLKPITKSPNQFVATPIADLILRLSISLARPIGNGNGTASFFNIPIRLSNNGIEENTPSLNSTTSKVGSEEGNKLIDVAVPHSINAEVSENHEINDKEDDDDKDQEST
ncbi:protein PFC0760c-like [Episyrphus balteatus]|uniref:protein PFC0760c-like n=1 Tax=Episyrphus balteatus TaxID=286459 RepID=UPI002485E089|nr:protein PFC0760c-like [Episyrphus balteatus]